jgi:Fe-Mn family superoxide dismutase
MDAMLPHLSAESFEYHHQKHHGAYVANLNNFVPNSIFLNNTLEQIILLSSQNKEYQAIFNNAAQIWNHTFFWNSMSPSGGGAPMQPLHDRIVKDFGSFQAFVEEFKNAGLAQFGSGWVWLVWNGEKLQVVKTTNADTPITSGVKPIIVCDVWEHAYYIDYRNRRAGFLGIFMDCLVNWDFANKNLSAAMKW